MVGSLGWCWGCRWKRRVRLGVSVGRLSVLEWLLRVAPAGWLLGGCSRVSVCLGGCDGTAPGSGRTASTVAVRPMTSRHVATDSAGVPSCAASWANALVSPTPDAAADSSCSHPACVSRRASVPPPPCPPQPCRRCRRPLEGLLLGEWRQALAEHRQATHRTHATAMATATYALHPAGEGSFGSPIGFLVGAVVRRTRTLRVAVHGALVPMSLRLRRLLPHEGAPHALSHLL